MNRPQKITFSVTNDLTYDQRMIRICSTLARAGYEVTLVGRKLRESVPLQSKPYRQKRLNCLFSSGFLFYAEFNTRLFFYLLFQKADILGAVDLDTIIPTYLTSRLKRTRRVYDAHELFCEMKEVVTRPSIHRFWKGVEKRFVPKFKYGYTVNKFISCEFNNMYGVDYPVIQNLPVFIENLSGHEALPTLPFADTTKKLIIYQGTVNEARCFESLIPAMQSIDANLLVCGDGNFMNKAKQLSQQHNLSNKIHFTGWIEPGRLIHYTLQADIGVNIIESNGRNNIYSLANRFFDYIQAALPQVCVDYPAYREINDQYHCALLISNTDEKTIVQGINELLHNQTLYNQIKANCQHARTHLTWNIEEHELIDFYKNVVADER
jgi:glycosyltransferase involved in cell wall biosynthesis